MNFHYISIPYHDVLLENARFEKIDYEGMRPSREIGAVTGTVVRGTTTNRLFHHTSVRHWEVGKEHTFHYVAREDFERGIAEYHTCG